MGGIASASAGERLHGFIDGSKVAEVVGIIIMYATLLHLTAVHCCCPVDLDFYSFFGYPSVYFCFDIGFGLAFFVFLSSVSIAEVEIAVERALPSSNAILAQVSGHKNNSRTWPDPHRLIVYPSLLSTAYPRSAMSPCPRRQTCSRGKVQVHG